MSTPTEPDDALFVAILQVCEKSFFAFVESCDSLQFAVLVAKTDCPEKLRDAGALKEPARPTSYWLKASVDFQGTLSSGAIDVILPEGLGRWLVATLLGISREVDLNEVELRSDQVFDGVGEFANMICGAWLTDLSDSQAFTLGAPVVTREPAGWSPLTGLSDDGGLRLSVDDQPMRILVRSSTN